MSAMSIKEQIAAYLAATGLTVSELARRSGVAQPTIHRILSGESKEPRGSTVAPLLRHMDAYPAGKRTDRPAPWPAYSSSVTRIRHIDAALDTETLDTPIHGRTLIGPLQVKTPWLQVMFPDTDVTNLVWGHPGISVSISRIELSPDDVLLIDCGQRDPTTVDGLYAMEFVGFSGVSRLRPNLSYHHFERVSPSKLRVSTANISEVVTPEDGLTANAVGRVIYQWSGRPL